MVYIIFKKGVIMFMQFIEFLAGIKMTIVSALCLLLSLVCLILDVTPFFNPVWLTIFISGIPIVFRAFNALFVRRKMTSPLLITTAMIAAISIDEIFAAGEVALIMAVGEILEDITVDKAKKGIENLLKLTPTQGRKVTQNGDVIIDIHQIKKGDTLRILPGEIIPADGIIISGSTSINQANLTGESLPVDKTVNDTVMAGTLNCFGSIDITVTAITDTFLQKMITLIEQAQQNKSPTELLIDKLASILVPTSLLIALVTYFLTGEIIRAVTILVVFCPCALVLATPISVISAMTSASKNGILVKSGAALEMMGKVDTFIFDKTGTLTEGNITVTDVISFDTQYSCNDILALTASLEKFSEHPLAKAVLTSATMANLTFSSVAEFKMLPGKGVTGIIQGKFLISGNLAFLQSNHVSISDEQLRQISQIQDQGKTLILTALEYNLIGYIALSDTVRPEAKNVIHTLQPLSKNIVILSGDNLAAAQYLGNMVNITHIYANLLPSDKVLTIQSLKANGACTCMIGDGINDAPSLKIADVGIAMGKLGNDITVDAADIALIDNNLTALPRLKQLSIATLKTIKQNLLFSLFFNLFCVSISIVGLIGPLAGAILHNVSSLVVIFNASKLRHK